ALARRLQQRLLARPQAKQLVLVARPFDVPLLPLGEVGASERGRVAKLAQELDVDAYPGPEADRDQRPLPGVGHAELELGSGDGRLAVPAVLLELDEPRVGLEVAADQQPQGGVSAREAAAVVGEREAGRAVLLGRRQQ